MPRKANFFNSDSKSETMSRKEQEQYYTAIKHDMDGLREDIADIKKDMRNLRTEVMGRLDVVEKRLEKSLDTILTIVRGIDGQLKEMKIALYEHDRRILKLERELFGQPNY